MQLFYKPNIHDDDGDQARPAQFIPAVAPLAMITAPPMDGASGNPAPPTIPQQPSIIPPPEPQQPADMDQDRPDKRKPTNQGDAKRPIKYIQLPPVDKRKLDNPHISTRQTRENLT